MIVSSAARPAEAGRDHAHLVAGSSLMGLLAPFVAMSDRPISMLER